MPLGIDGVQSGVWSRRVAATVLTAGVLLGLAGGVSGCSKQRPLHIVRQQAQFATEQRNWPKAIADYEEYLRRRPEMVEVRYDLARAYLDSGDPGKAIEHFRIVLDVYPLNDDYLDGLADAMLAANRRDDLTALLSRYASERGRPIDFLRQGEFALKLGNVDEASQAIRTSAKLFNNTSARPFLSLSKLYNELGDRERQVRYLRMAYAIQPANKETLELIRAAGEIPGPTFAMTPDTSGL